MVQGHDTASDMIGRVFFGEYTIIDRLGEGGMGAVYLAEQNQIDQKIALKVLHTESAESDEIIQRFHREAKVISMLSHPNIVRVFIFGRTEDDLLFLVMEFVDGHELRDDMISGEPLDELRAIKITKQICSAVAEAHDLGIIHRDLKPENILLTTHRGEDNFVKILDFGIAKIKYPDEQQGPQLTQAGIVYGTPEYLSPEQAQAEDLDQRTDIYSLGCMLYEMMTGQVPFSAQASVDVLKMQVFDDPTPPSEVADVAPTMENIILKAMEKDREDRYNNALEMFDDLVHREEEIRSENKLDEGATWFPGSELTGVHTTIDDQIDSERETIDKPPPNVADAPNTSPDHTGDGESHRANSDAAPAAQSDSIMNADTAAMESPDQAALQSDDRSEPTPDPGPDSSTVETDDPPPERLADDPNPSTTPAENKANDGTAQTPAGPGQTPPTNPKADRDDLPIAEDDDQTIRTLLMAGIMLATTVIVVLVVWIGYMLYFS